MTAAELEDLGEHLVELVVQLLVLLKVIANAKPPPVDDLPENNNAPRPG